MEEKTMNKIVVAIADEWGEVLSLLMNESDMVKVQELLMHAGAYYYDNDVALLDQYSIQSVYEYIEHLIDEEISNGMDIEYIEVHTIYYKEGERLWK